MTQRSLPWDAVSPGDAGPYSSAEWAQLWQYLIGTGAHRANVGVMLGSGDSGVDGLRVNVTSPVSSNIEVTSGSALVNGRLYMNDATVTLAVTANGSGNPRIDTVILRADFTAQTVRLIVKAGTAAASPVPPTLTQVANVLWEIPLYDIAVANGFLSIAAADISPRAEYANAADGVYLDMVLNNSGAELNTGDVVVFDTTTNRAVATTTTASNPDAAGVWVGRTANGSYGRVLTDGIGLVRVNGAVASRGSLLATSTTAKQAAVVSGGAGVFGTTLETTSGAGLCLAYIRTTLRTATGTQATSISDRTIGNTTTETTMFGASLSGSLTLPANTLVAGKSVKIIISGYIGTNSTNTVITARLKLGGNTVASFSFTLPASQSGNHFWLEAILTCRTAGGSGTVIGQLFFGDSSGSGNREVGGSAQTTTTTIDTTTAQALDVTWQWTTANSNNTITLTNGIVEVA